MIAVQEVKRVDDGRRVFAGSTYQEYLAAVETYCEERVEFVEGDVIVTPAPIPRHQIVASNLMWLLSNIVRQQRAGMVLTAPLDVELAADIVQPDIIFVAHERIGQIIGKTRITGAPDLAVEILSPATAHTDRKRKLLLYAAHGIAEYWIVDPDDQSIEVYVLDGTTYRVAGIYLEGETVAVGRFAQAGIAVNQVFAI